MGPPLVVFRGFELSPTNENASSAAQVMERFLGLLHGKRPALTTDAEKAETMRSLNCFLCIL